MRIIQLIDSLEPGGAERMAVNYANLLATEVAFSGLVTTRKEGTLANQLNEKVGYVFLNRKHTFDINALLELKKFIKKSQVNVVHAHGTSFFMAFLLKLIYPPVRLIWHDHYGKSEFLEKRPSLIFKLIMPFFDGIIVVNQKLKVWAERKLKFRNVIYLPNFPSITIGVHPDTILNGIEGKRILCLANLRAQKNHFLLLNVAKRLKVSYPEWTFHLVGKDFKDDYSQQIKNKLDEMDLKKTVYCYNSKQDTENILRQVSIGVLSSNSEGLPLALLEYGLHKKPVVVTAVGEIPSIVIHGQNGFMVESQNENLFYELLVNLIEDEQQRTDFGEALYKNINEGFSGKSVVQNYMNWIQKKQK